MPVFSIQKSGFEITEAEKTEMNKTANTSMDMVRKKISLVASMKALVSHTAE